MSSVSIIITSFNRPHHLQRLLHYFRGRGLKASICVADWSSVSEHELIKQVVEKFKKDLNIVLLKYQNEIHPVIKISDALNKVETTYTAILNEDDFLIPEGIDFCARYLDSNPDYSCALGDYYWFRVEKQEGRGGYFVKKSPAYVYPSIDESKISERLFSIANSGVEYLSALYRTEELKKNYQSVVDHYFKNPEDELWENDPGYMKWSWAALVFMFLSGVTGKIERVPALYCYREIHRKKLTHSEAGWGSICTNEKFFNSYFLFKKILNEKLESSGKDCYDGKENFIEKAMITFLSNAMNLDPKRIRSKGSAGFSKSFLSKILSLPERLAHRILNRKKIRTEEKNQADALENIILHFAEKTFKG